MSGLLQTFNEMSTEQQEGLGKGATKINQAGSHLVTIEAMTEIDGNRVKIDLKNNAGQAIDITLFTQAKDPSKQEATTNRVMGTIARLCTAAGTEMKKVLSKSVEGTVEFKSGTVPTTTYPGLKGKKLYIITSTELEGDDKDPKKVWVKQQVDTRHFFDTRERSGLEISSDAEEGTTMAGIAEEAKKSFEINYRHTANAACQAKLAQLQGGSVVNTAAASTEDIDDNDI